MKLHEKNLRLLSAQIFKGPDNCWSHAGTIGNAAPTCDQWILAPLKTKEDRGIELFMSMLYYSFLPGIQHVHERLHIDRERRKELAILSGIRVLDAEDVRMEHLPLYTLDI